MSLSLHALQPRLGRLYSTVRAEREQPSWCALHKGYPRRTVAAHRTLFAMKEPAFGENFGRHPALVLSTLPAGEYAYAALEIWLTFKTDCLT